MNQIQAFFKFSQRISFLLLIIIEIAKCNVESITPISISFSKVNNTAYQLYKYCEEGVCSALKSMNSNYLSNEQVYKDCLEDHYSCSQQKDFEIQFEMCQGYCHANITSKYNNTDFINYLNCQDSCLDIVQRKQVFDSDDQEANYPFYRQYSQCYEANCTNTIIDSQNSQNFKYYITIFFVCYDNQSLCQTARSNYNVTQVKSYCYDACINSFKENNDTDAFSDPDFKNLLTCDISCLNQTIDYMTDFYQRMDDELNGRSDSSGYEEQTEVKLLFWIVLAIGVFFLACVSCAVIYYMKIHSKTSKFKYETKFTDSDEDDDEEEEDENEDDQDDEEDRNQDGAGYPYPASINRVGDYQVENGDGPKRLKPSEQEGVGRRIQFKKRSKVLQREDGINIEIKDNMSKASYQAGNAYTDQILAQKKMQFKDDIEVNSEYDNHRQEENDHDNEGDQSGQYDFTKDKSKNYSMHMNSHKNLKEQMRDSGRLGRLQTPEPSEAQGRRQRKMFEDKSPSPPHKLNTLKQNQQIAQIKANQTMNVQRPEKSNSLQVLELQNYGISAQNFSPDKKRPLKITTLESQPILNQINLDKLFQQKQHSNKQNIEQDSVRDGEDEFNKDKGNNEEQFDNGTFRGRLNAKKRQTQQSIISPHRNTIIMPSNQIFSDINFISDQSPSSQTNQAILQKQIISISQNDQQQFNNILNKMKKGAMQNFSDKLDKFDSHQEIMIPHDEISSPELVSIQKNQLGLASSTVESVYQFQPKKLSNASKTSQIPSSHTVDESRFISSTNQNQINASDQSTQQQLLSQKQQDNLNMNNQFQPNKLSEIKQQQQFQDKIEQVPKMQVKQNLNENKAGEILNISQQLESENSYLHMDSSPKIVQCNDDDDNEDQSNQIGYQQNENKQSQHKTKARVLSRPEKRDTKKHPSISINTSQKLDVKK